MSGRGKSTGTPLPSSSSAPGQDRGRPKHRGPAPANYDSEPSDAGSDVDDAPLTDLLFAFIEERKGPALSSTKEWVDALCLLLATGLAADAEEVFPLVRLATESPEVLAAMHAGFRKREHA